MLLCDEVAGAWDGALRAACARRVREEQQARGMGALWITHDLALAATVCDEIVLLVDGRVVHRGPPALADAAPSDPDASALVEAYRGDLAALRA